MSRRVIFLVAVVYGLVCLGWLLSLVYEPLADERDALVAPVEDLPELTALAWGVYDIEAKTLVYGTQATTVLPIASVTKLIAAATIRDGYDMTTSATITWSDVAAEGRAGGLTPGQETNYQELLLPLLMESSNDAAAVFERTIGTSELVKGMEQFAQRIGMQQTVLRDASGLSGGNQSTVADLSAFVANIYSTQPHLFDLTRQREYLTSAHGWHNNNPLVNDVGYLGGKHGYTPEAGRTAVAVFTEVFPKGVEIPVVYTVLGSSDLQKDIRTLRELVRTRGLGR